MFRMCKIIFLVIIQIALFCFQASAAVQEFEFGLSSQQVNNSSALYGLGDETQTKEFSQYLSYRNPSLFESVFFGIGIQTKQADYSSLVFIDENQAQYSPESQGTQLKANTNFRYDFSSNLSAGFSINSDLLQTPFFSYGTRADIQSSFYNQSTQIGLEWSLQFSERPIDHYVNDAFRTVSRPTKYQAHQVGFSYEQTLSEEVKVRIKPKALFRNPDRPTALGGGLEFAYHPFSRVFLKLGSSYVSELRSQLLKDDRGYYSVLTAYVESNFEVTYDLSVTPFYGFTRELEEDSRRSLKRQVGVDRYGLGVQNNFQKFDIKTKFFYDDTNTNYSGLGLEANIIWTI